VAIDERLEPAQAMLRPTSGARDGGSLPRPTMPGAPRIEPVLCGVFVACLAFHLWAVTGGLGAPLLDAHAFRQTQTAITTYWLLRGGPWIDYETPVLGPPWSIPFELPLYQWTVAAFVRVTGLPLDPAGRVVSELFFLATLPACWLVLRGLGIARRHRWPFLSLLVVSPLYVFWSRTFMIESAALCLAVAYAAAVLAWTARPSRARAGVALAVGALAAATKITTFAGFAALAILVVPWRARRLGAAAMVGLPLLAGAAWHAHADAVKAANPIAAGFLTSDALGTWSFGTAAQRLAPDTWRTAFARTLRDVLGTPWVVVVAALGVAVARRRAGLFVGALGLFVGPFLVFTNLHVVHDYYAYANGVFLVAAVAAAVLALLESGGGRRVAAVALLLAAAGCEIRAYLRDVRPRQTRAVQSPRDSELGRLVRARTRPGDVLVVYGEDWSPVLPYYLERRAIMDRGARDPAAPPEHFGSLDPSGPAMQASLRALGGPERVAALLVCQGKQTQTTLVRALRTALRLEHAPPHRTARCDVYLRRTDPP
jgi:hypothetical protein